jgi:mono/diheme cytochrome c family protein
MKPLLASALLLLAASPAVLAAGDAAAGKTAFNAHCAACHGADAKGQTPMAKAFQADLDLTGKSVQALKDPGLADIIKNGKGKMPKPPGVTDDDVPNLIAYVRTLAAK